MADGAVEAGGLDAEPMAWLGDGLVATPVGAGPEHAASAASPARRPIAAQTRPREKVKPATAPGPHPAW